MTKYPLECRHNHKRVIGSRTMSMYPLECQLIHKDVNASTKISTKVRSFSTVYIGTTLRDSQDTKSIRETTQSHDIVLLQGKETIRHILSDISRKGKDLSLSFSYCLLQPGLSTSSLGNDTGDCFWNDVFVFNAPSSFSRTPFAFRVHMCAFFLTDESLMNARAERNANLFRRWVRFQDASVKGREHRSVLN
ncbi:hypothetical protein BaRGS_00034692 [Batillaria attramentaria]|uniref:Uncharacterized protein n=1 Tax=Batillaria attramentaria TaxID=370345 RepID=A0ABD0JGP1_9CAEN